MSDCASCSIKGDKLPCPAKMNDARSFTDYSPRCAINARLMSYVQQADKMTSSFDVRRYLQTHALEEMERQRLASIETLAPCAPCKGPTPSTMAPERYVVRCDAVSCQRMEVNPAGIGDGRAY